MHLRKIVLFSPVLFIFVLALVSSGSIWAQESECVYDKNAPSLDNARLNFKSLKYRCAESEMLDRLRMKDLSLEEKADAHVLLAAVYFAMLRDDGARRAKVLEQFMAAYQFYADWKGELDISSAEFAGLMAEAKQRVESGESAEKPTTQPMAVSACPSSKPAWISTGIATAATGFFIYAALQTGSKWDDYESDPTDDQYDSYKSANSLRNITGIAAITGVAVTGYLWMKNRSAKKDCVEPGRANINGTEWQISPTSNGLALSFRF
jgi:hypothetical protein